MKTHELKQSNFLKKEDVGEDGVIVTVGEIKKANVAMEGADPEFKWTMQFDEFEKPMVLNTTNVQLAEKAFGSDETDDWIGKQIIVYSDPNVSFAGKLTGGLRLRKYNPAPVAPRRAAPSAAPAAPRKPNPQRDVPTNLRRPSNESMADLQNDPPWEDMPGEGH